MNDTYRAIYIELIHQEIRQIPDEHLSSLLETIRLFRQMVTLKLADESFRQGWQEAIANETLPLSDLWVDIDVDQSTTIS